MIRSLVLQNIRVLARVAMMAIFAIGGGAPAHAAPHVPTNDRVILLELPRALGASLSRTGELNDALRKNPQDLAAATELATIYLRAAKESGGARYYGYAESVLRVWLDTESLPAQTLSLRADIHQYFHRFDSAAGDYLRLAQQQPGNAKAWFSLAMALQNRGDLREALAVCQKLASLDPRAWKMCVGYVASVGPNIRQGYALLQSAFEEQRDRHSGDLPWTLTALADAAARMERSQEADRFFRDAFEIAPQSAAVYLPYSDFLLDQSRYPEALEVLAQDGGSLSGLVRKCMIYVRTEDPMLTQAKRELAGRLSQRRLRGDPPHYSDEIRAQLYVFGSSALATDLALQNWRLMKTPGDARLLLESGLAAGHSEAVRLAREWLRENNGVYPRLARLAAKDSAAQGG